MFRGGQPNPYDDIVVKATDENQTSENWEIILNLCDKVMDEGESGARNVVAAVLKRLVHRNPNVQLYALAVVEALSKNCGIQIHREIASRSFTQGLEKLVLDRTAHDKVKRKVLSLIAIWTEEWQNDPSLSIMEETYSNLKAKNFKFDAPPEAPPPQVEDDIRRREEEELQRVLELSMSDKGGRPAWSIGYSAAPSSSSSAPPPASSSSSAPGPGPAPAYSQPSRKQEPSRPAPAPAYVPPAAPVATSSTPVQAPRAASPVSPAMTPVNIASTTSSSSMTRVRALHAFEPTEPGELAFDKGDIIKVVDRNYKDWWRGQLRGRTGIFPVNYVESLPDPTPAELAKEAEQEAAVFAQAANIDKLLNMLRSFDPAKDNLADNDEIQELYRSSMVLRPKIVKLIDKYSQKRNDLVFMNESFVKARSIFERMMEDSLARHTGLYAGRQPPGPQRPEGQPFGWNQPAYGQPGYPGVPYGPGTPTAAPPYGPQQHPGQQPPQPGAAYGPHQPHQPHQPPHGHPGQPQQPPHAHPGQPQQPPPEAGPQYPPQPYGDPAFGGYAQQQPPQQPAGQPQQPPYGAQPYSTPPQGQPPQGQPQQQPQQQPGQQPYAYGQPQPHQQPPQGQPQPHQQPPQGQPQAHQQPPQGQPQPHQHQPQGQQQPHQQQQPQGQPQVQPQPQPQPQQSLPAQQPAQQQPPASTPTGAPAGGPVAQLPDGKYPYDPAGHYADPNVQLWAQYYAQGGKDPAGAVYFVSVPGVTDGAPPAGEQPQPQQGAPDLSLPTATPTSPVQTTHSFSYGGGAPAAGPTSPGADGPQPQSGFPTQPQQPTGFPLQPQHGYGTQSPPPGAGPGQMGYGAQSPPPNQSGYGAQSPPPGAGAGQPAPFPGPAQPPYAVDGQSSPQPGGFPVAHAGPGGHPGLAGSPPPGGHPGPHGAPQGYGNVVQQLSGQFGQMGLREPQPAS